jgi:hypothetical protein
MKMASIQQNIKIKTDGNGTFSHKQSLNIPGTPPIQVKALVFEILAPAATTVSGEISIHSSGSPADSVKFSISTGEKAVLGEWNLPSNSAAVLISGETAPVRPNTIVEIELTVTF